MMCQHHLNLIKLTLLLATVYRNTVHKLTFRNALNKKKLICIHHQLSFPGMELLVIMGLSIIAGL